MTSLLHSVVVPDVGGDGLVVPQASGVAGHDDDDRFRNKLTLLSC